MAKKVNNKLVSKEYPKLVKADFGGDKVSESPVEKHIPQEQGTEEDQKIEESMTLKPEYQNKPEEFNLELNIKIQEDRTWKCLMKDEDKVWEGEANTPMDSVRSMLNNIELFNVKDEVVKMRRFMVLNFDSAKALVLQIKDILGPDMGHNWFTVYQLVVKTGQQKQELEKKLVMLQTY